MATFDPFDDLQPEEGMTLLPPIELTPEDLAEEAALIERGAEIYRAEADAPAPIEFPSKKFGPAATPAPRRQQLRAPSIRRAQSNGGS